MGEQAIQEQAKVEAPAVPQPEEKPADEEKKEDPRKAPSPIVLFVDFHCIGCAKKIEKSIMKIKGVESVVIDLSQNQATIKGMVEPQAICNKIMMKIKRVAKVLSPLPAAEGDPIPMPEVVTPQANEPTTVELNVDMHCQACADQLKKKILKMKGVQTTVAERSTGKVTVTGTMDANKLVDYVYRRTKKQARIVPQPEPEKKEEAKEPEKPAEKAKSAEEKSPEEIKKEGGEEERIISEEEGTKRIVHYYEPLYVIERMPPAPQLFSDENPNACSIS